MEAHLKQMKEITDRLAAIGAPISEEDQVVTLLGSVPPSYSTLVTALESRLDGVKLSYVQQALIHEEKKRREQPSETLPSSPTNSALLGTHEMGFPRRAVRCYGCGGLGHIRRFCRAEKRSGDNMEPAHKAKIAEAFEGDGVFAALTGPIQPSQVDTWLVDSGASTHMTREKGLLLDYREFEKPEMVGLGDGKTVEAVGVGTVRMKMLSRVSNHTQCVFQHVLYVPRLACNLFLVRAAAAKGNTVKFGIGKCWIRDRDGKLKGMGTLVGKLYQLDCEPVTVECVAVASQLKSGVDMWHQRFGHLNGQQLQRIAQKDLVTGVKIPQQMTLSFCEGCVEGKMHRAPFKPVGEIRSTRRLQLVHSDVCGPMQTESLGGRKYFVTFIDDYSRCCDVYFLKSKSEVFGKFKEFEASVTNESDRSIGTLRTDNGGEYLSGEFKEYLKSKGIRHELTVPHSPQQNGVAERMNRTLIESARTMIAHAGLPNSYWAEAVATAAYVRNRMPTTAIKNDQTPYERWYGRKPNVSHLRVFGCVAYAHVPDSERQKLDKKAVKLRFVGYAKMSKGYRLLDWKTEKIVTRRDVVFNETNFCFETEPEPAKPQEVGVEVEGSMEHGHQQEVPSDVQPRCSDRAHRRPVRFGIDEYADVATVENSVQHFSYNACQIMEPKSMEEALSSDHAKEWKAATDSEVDSLLESETWELVELPPDRKPIGGKWVFKVKHGSDGSVEWLKGQLVAKGCSQKYGIDYDETYFPVVRFSSIRGLLAFAVQNSMLIHQMDVVTTFLNGKLDEEIYMAQPDGYVEAGKEHLVCKLKKSVYGLKQSPWCWNRAFSEYLESIGFEQSAADPCVYIRSTEPITIIAVYVDDLILITKPEEVIKNSDADWAGDLDDRHSTTGNVFLMAGGAISWMNKKQAIVALSTSEAEYVALSSATQEAVWLRRLRVDLRTAPKEPTVLMEDNQGVIAIARNPIRTKHIDIRYHYVREALQEGTIDLFYCPTEEMVADWLTKPLSRGPFEKLRLAMGMNTVTAAAQVAN